MSLYMIQMQLDPMSFVRFLESQGLNRKEDEDLGYGAHAWLTSVFGELAPRPFRVLMAARDRRPPKILGYAQQPHSVLVERARSFSEPFTLSVCDLDRHIDSRKMPNRWATGTRLGFEVLACPVGRKSRSGVEKDIYLIRADAEGSSKRLTREKVYGAWLAGQLEPACRVERLELRGFHLVNQARRSSSMDKNRQGLARLVRPQAHLAGHLEVMDDEAFGKILTRGVGRHRAFGYGMLLLRPA
jgi:CRISPR system Cascade subunit CasE